jgi:hypothetical protein
MRAEFKEIQLRIHLKAMGTEPLGIRVAHALISPTARSGPLYVVVNPANPVDRLTVDQLAHIFSTAGNDDETVMPQAYLPLNPSEIETERAKMER